MVPKRAELQSIGRGANLGVLCRKRKDSVAGRGASRHAVGMNRCNYDSGVSALLVATLALGLNFLGGCETIKGLGGDDDRPAEIREVVATQTPFYNSYPGKKSIPFIYLTQGTAIEWLKRKDNFAKVKLANGQSGWMPEVSLGPPVGGWPVDPETPESKPTREAMRDVRSRAIRTGRKDESLNQFNISN